MTTIIFNLNPAIKLDGYYVLSDLTGQHNIASRGTTAARDWLTRRLGGQADRPDPAVSVLLAVFLRLSLDALREHILDILPVG